MNAREQRGVLAGHGFLQAMATLPLCVLELDRPCSPVVTAADASQWGGAVTASEGLTSLGKKKLSIAEKKRTVGPADHLVVVDWFAGI